MAKLAASRTEIIGALSDLRARRDTLVAAMNAEDDQGEVNAYEAVIRLMDQARDRLTAAADVRVREHLTDPAR